MIPLKNGVFCEVYTLPPRVETIHQRFNLEIEESPISKRFITFLENYKMTENDLVVFDEIFKYVEKQINYEALIKGFAQEVGAVSTKYLNELKQYFQDWEFAQTAGHKNAVRFTIKQKHSESLIDIFFNAQLLPKYGSNRHQETLLVSSAKNMFELSRKESFMALFRVCAWFKNSCRWKND